MTEQNDFPFEIHDVEEEELMKYYQTFPNGFVRVGPKGYFFPKRFKVEGPMMYNMDVRPSDIFVLTYPRSGTTWTQEIVWLIANDLDYDKAKTMALNKRFPCMELSLVADEKFYAKLLNETEDMDKKRALLSVTAEPSCNRVFAAASPRFIKSHLPISLLPPAMLDTAKVIYVARDPRDAVVSFFHLLCPLGWDWIPNDFEAYWKCFKNGFTQWGPYFPHVKEAWEKRNHPNMLFLFHEELSKDLASVVKRVAEFLGKNLNEEQISELCHHVQFENFKNNNSVNGGKSGGWRSYFDEEMTREAEEWMSENMRDTDFRFPRIID